MTRITENNNAENMPLGRHSSKLQIKTSHLPQVKNVLWTFPQNREFIGRKLLTLAGETARVKEGLGLLGNIHWLYFLAAANAKFQKAKLLIK